MLKNHHAAPHCQLLFNIAHIPGELTTDWANLVYPERSLAVAIFRAIPANPAAK
jgi:hypothetical protein